MGRMRYKTRRRKRGKIRRRKRKNSRRIVTDRRTQGFQLSTFSAAEGGRGVRAIEKWQTVERRGVFDGGV